MLVSAYQHSRAPACGAHLHLRGRHMLVPRSTGSRALIMHYEVVAKGVVTPSACRLDVVQCRFLRCLGLCNQCSGILEAESANDRVIALLLHGEHRLRLARLPCVADVAVHGRRVAQQQRGNCNNSRHSSNLGLASALLVVCTAQTLDKLGCHLLALLEGMVVVRCSTCKRDAELLHGVEHDVLAERRVADCGAGGEQLRELAVDCGANAFIHDWLLG